MNPRLLELYNQELHHVRESAAEFAKEYPKIASRLTLSGMDCADPAHRCRAAVQQPRPGYLAAVPERR